MLNTIQIFEQEFKDPKEKEVALKFNLNINTVKYYKRSFRRCTLKIKTLEKLLGKAGYEIANKRELYGLLKWKEK